ncbi:MAG: amidohydrolase family protein [Candidatus Aminicenantes bacterium]|nr:amidohydrolase family protein [Candidatus Aminicenantes bacterium]
MKTRRMFKAIANFILILCVGHSAWTSRPLDRFDVLIKNTTVVDGTGAPAFKGDIAIKGERIYALGKVSGDAGIVIDGTGLISCPGFIDPHSHGDNGLLKFPAAENLIMQGITTFVGGNCGQSQAPQKGLSFDQYLAMVEKTGISVNFAPLVGHNQIRSLVMGNDFKRKATPEEISRMKEFVEEAMKSGALGLSAGLDYYPGEYAGEEELVPLTKIAGEHGGLFVLHQRHRNSDWPGTPEEWKYGVYHGPIEDVWIGRYRGVWEALEISKKAHVPLHIAHICNIYRIMGQH